MIRRLASTLAAVALAGGLTACRHPLPASDSPQARIYQRRCGQCHLPFDPRALTAAMWSRQVGLMEERIRKAGMPPLSDEERQAILDYLSRNSTRQ